MVMQKLLEICYVLTEEQIADIMTKPLSMSRFQYLMVKLTLGHSPFCLWGCVETHVAVKQIDQAQLRIS